MTYTDNLNLKIPALGENADVQDINDNFSTIDEELGRDYLLISTVPVTGLTMRKWKNGMLEMYGTLSMYMYESRQERGIYRRYSSATYSEFTEIYSVTVGNDDGLWTGCRDANIANSFTVKQWSGSVIAGGWVDVKLHIVGKWN